MAAHDFSHLKRYDPQGRTVEWTVPIEGRPRLIVCHAGLGNVGYTNALAKRNARTASARRGARAGDTAAVIADQLQADRELFPGHAVKGWFDVKDRGGRDVEFSVVACTAFLAALPDWIMRDLSRFCAQSSNFLEDDEPDDAEVEDEAGE